MAGITTSGTIIRCEDNAHADAGGDGDYSFADISTKLPAIFHDLNPGATHRMYGSDYTLQNGDGVGTAATTIKDSDCTLEFAAGKTYTVSPTGVANRRTEFGTLIEGAAGKPTGIKGVNLVLQATSSFRGQLGIYGSRLIQESGSLVITPGVSGIAAEIVNCLLESSVLITSGAAGVNSLRRIYNVDFGLSGLTARVVNMVADSTERVVMGGQSIATLFATAADFSAKDLVFAGTPSTSDLQYTGTAEVDLIQPTWSGNAPQVSIMNAYLNEWWLYDPYAHNPVTGSPVSGVPLQLYDKFGTLLVDAVTDALGRVTFGVGNFENMVKARRVITVPSYLDEPLGPMTVVVNSVGTIHSGYLGYSYKFLWPYHDLPNGYGRQLLPVGDAIPLVPKYGGGAGREEWRGGFA